MKERNTAQDCVIVTEVTLTQEACSGTGSRRGPSSRGADRELSFKPASLLCSSVITRLEHLPCSERRLEGKVSLWPCDGSVRSAVCSEDERPPLQQSWVCRSLPDARTCMGPCGPTVGPGRLSISCSSSPWPVVMTYCRLSGVLCTHPRPPAEPSLHPRVEGRTQDRPELA